MPEKKRGHAVVAVEKGITKLIQIRALFPAFDPPSLAWAEALLVRS
jgi:hypothetical protein